MILGFILGVLMPSWRAVAFGSVGGALTNLAMFFAVYRQSWVAEGTVTDDAAGWAIVAVTGYLVPLCIGTVVYWTKRLFIERDRASDAASL